MREFQRSPRAFLNSRFLPFGLAALVLMHTGILFYSSQYNHNVIEQQWAAGLPRSANGSPHLRGFPFISGHVVDWHAGENPIEKMTYYWPGALANLLFVISCTAATFITFDSWRKSKPTWQFSTRAIFRLVTFFALAFTAITQLPTLDQFVFPRLGLMRSFGVSGLPLKLILFLGMVCAVLLMAEAILLGCEFATRRTILLSHKKPR